MANEHRILHFSGMVQDVGFRFTACRVADNYDVTGYVCNLPDGCVECVVEGPSEQIDAFQQELADAMAGYIQSHTQQQAAYTGKFSSFNVRF